MEFLNNLLINIGNGLVWLFSLLWDYVVFSYTLHIGLINQAEKYPYAVVFIVSILFFVSFVCYFIFKINEDEHGDINFYELKIPVIVILLLLFPFLLPFGLIRILLDKREIVKKN